MTTNEKLIVQLAKDFINAYWNVPFDFACTSWKGSILEYISKGEGKTLTIDKLTRLLSKDLGLACWIVQEILVYYEDEFKFLGNNYIVAEIDGYELDFIKINNKYLRIEDDKVIEYKKKIIQVETFEKELENEK